MRRSKRRGTVLILILVLIPVLALGGYAFTHAMRAEAQASQAAIRLAQVRWLADSGVEAVKAFLSDPTNLQPGGVDFYNNGGQFAAQAVEGVDDALKGAFSIVAPNEDGSGAIRYGLVNECCKIPLNSKKIKLTSAILMNLPNMTQDVADSIVDWIDADDNPLGNGAESAYYGALNPPVLPRNGPPLAIDELLQVKGMTAALLYGNDANLDGVFSPNEGDGEQNWPNDAGDGSFSRGFYPYLTVYSISDNHQPDGTKKINLNGSDVKGLVAQLQSALQPDITPFYVAYKMSNPQLTAISSMIDAQVNVDLSQYVAALTAAGLDPQTVLTGMGLKMPPPADPMTQGGTGQSKGGASGGRGGGAAAAPPTPPTPIKSPWTSANASQYLDKALTMLTLENSQTIPGLIDVQYAPPFVLQALPGVDADLATKINTAGQAKTGIQTSTAWLLTDNVTTLAQFQKIETSITASGRVFRVESVGFFNKTGPVARVEAIIDASGQAPKVILRRDLSALGNAYPQEMLRSSATTPPSG